MSLGVLTDVFARAKASWHTPEALVPWRAVADLLRLDDERYAVDPQKRMIARHPEKEDPYFLSAGPVRALYTDPDRTITFERQLVPDFVIKKGGQVIELPETETIKLHSSASVMTTDNGKNFTAAICGPVTDTKSALPDMFFSIQGIRERNGDFRIRRMEVPAVDGDTFRVAGLRDVNLDDADDVATGWTYARFCADQMLTNNQSVTARQNMQRAQRLPPAELVSPWSTSNDPFESIRYLFGHGSDVADKRRRGYYPGKDPKKFEGRLKEEESERSVRGRRGEKAPASVGAEYDIKIEAQKSTTTFKDLAGIDEAAEECQDIVEYLKNPEEFTRLGGRVPKGTLLTGKPGGGKTLLARAVAGEAGVPFYAISGADFVKMLVGKGADNVGKLFAEAKKNQPCIIFIDEIDAIGKTRGGFNSNDEREATLNKILTEMDGFEQNEGIILIAATNRVDTLDPALLRPGRFDRQVAVPYPDEAGRRKILDVVITKGKIITDGPIDLDVLAKGAYDFSGAMLANIVNEAAIAAAKAKKKGVEQSDFLIALENEAMGGRELKSHKVSPESEERTSYHEAGHIVACLHGGWRRILKATVVPRQKSLGYVWSVPVHDDIAKDFLVNDMDMMLAGRAAEEIHFKTNFGPGAGGGPGSDIYNATDRARRMVTEWGMSKLGPVNYSGDQQQSPYGRSPVAETTATEIDKEIRRIVRGAHKSARGLLKEHWDEVERVAAALRERKTMTGDEIAAVAHGETLPPLAPVYH